MQNSGSVIRWGRGGLFGQKTLSTFVTSKETLSRYRGALDSQGTKAVNAEDDCAERMRHL